MKMARRSLPSLLYIPDILVWWDLVDEAARVVFTSLMQGLDRSVHMLILTTANCSQEDLPTDISSLFDEYQGEMFQVMPISEKQRELFFKQLFVHSACDLESNRSSQADLDQLPMSKQIKDVGRKRKVAGRIDFTENSPTQEVPPTRKSKLRTRNRVCTARSAHVMSNSKSKINVKRKNSASGEGPPSKRTRNSPLNLSTSSSEKLTDFQTEELLQKIVKMTESWLCYDLESLFYSLEMTLERNEEDLCSAVEDCIKQFKQLRRIKVHVKKEEEN
ncbi:ATPase family AAA domain-containing protein 2 [Eufriesea mexicana]|uniref:ATPase family AAA domain-containing protein 2 n=1 Tax=Eufriesea mexicana TaxID=516756 RepID=A0A310SAI2_9HYME|nr:ATPase family AAA domain-containing protein 2 [Eufriesea mexicana]